MLQSAELAVSYSTARDWQRSPPGILRSFQADTIYLVVRARLNRIFKVTPERYDYNYPYLTAPPTDSISNRMPTQTSLFARFEPKKKSACAVKDELDRANCPWRYSLNCWEMTT